MITIIRTLWAHNSAACVSLLRFLCYSIPLRKHFAWRVNILFYHTRKVLYCTTAHKFVYSYEAVKIIVAERLLKEQARLGIEITAPNIG
jgi:hypothetical protein